MKELKIYDFDNFLEKKTQLTNTNISSSINDKLGETTETFDKINNLLNNINNILNSPLIASLIKKNTIIEQPQPAKANDLDKVQLIKNLAEKLPEDMTIKDLRKELQQPIFKDSISK